ncbi:BRCA1-associated protein [Tetranychus urticae]|uniref:BRCA1-associated protein n=1 Tax=Tetranychus urticae TaxID=32264 RepID=T1KHK0_TETUR|nr:BRCA1-associated protein [Tetranychus urticae]
MSIHLVFIRLEIDDAYPLIPSIHYTAPKVMAQADNNTGLEGRKSLNPRKNNSKIKQKHRGFREMTDIEIETIDINADCKLTEGTSAGLVHGPMNRLASTSSKESSPEDSGACGGIEESSGSLRSASGACAPVETRVKDRFKNPMKQIHFYSGNHYVETTKGILHIYKENARTNLGEEAERSEMVCILSVPTSMTIHDLLQFTGPVNGNIEHIRIVRNNKPNQYMALIKFQNQKSSDEFYNNFNGVQFNSIEPEMCHLVYVAKVETIKEADDGYLPVVGHTELPTCPVCLERMDESVEGVLTILCNHSFHSGCLDKWGDTSCPVCRYCQTPESVPENRCFECASQESLWICLICGHIGCGRYVEGHAKSHYRETQHTYALELGMDNRVWDYAGDNYVHRLLQNKSDGKPVAVEYDNHTEDKIDSVQLEYTYLLTNQLETQRHYFEETICRIESEAEERIKDVIEKNKVILEEKDHLEIENQRLLRDKQTLEKKVGQLTSRLSKVLHDVQEEKEMNKCLAQNQDLWSQKLKQTEQDLKTAIEKKDTEIQELKEQVRDLMFFFEASNKLKDVKEATQEEIEEGQIVMGSSSTASASSSKQKHRSRRR